MGRLKIADIRPQLYVTAEGKAGRAADAAFRKGDTQMAAAEKRNQLVNHELARTAYAAQDEAVKIDRFFKRVVTPPDAKLKGRDMDIVNAARAVLSKAVSCFRAARLWHLITALGLLLRSRSSSAGTTPAISPTHAVLRVGSVETGRLGCSRAGCARAALTHAQ